MNTVNLNPEASKRGPMKMLGFVRDILYVYFTPQACENYTGISLNRTLLRGRLIHRKGKSLRKRNKENGKSNP